MTIFSVKSLSKSFHIARHQRGFWRKLSSLFLRQHDTRVALDHISFNVEEGETVGYIGPNGAGKSTTVKILAGILVPDSGDVSVFGKTPWKHRREIVRQIGVVFGQRTQLWWDLQVCESFELLKAIYSIPSHAYKRTLATLVDIFGLSKLLHIPVRQLSLGQRMRCDLAASLLHSPKILFLDEPTIGLDAASKLAVRNFIRHYNKEQKVTIFLTTHDMDDIESLCQRVIILNEGKVDFDGSLEYLTNKTNSERRLVIDLLVEGEVIEEKNFEIIRKEGNRIWMKFNPNLIPTAELISNITSKYTVADLFIESPSIEEKLAKLYSSNDE